MPFEKPVVSSPHQGVNEWWSWTISPGGIYISLAYFIFWQVSKITEKLKKKSIVNAHHPLQDSPINILPYLFYMPVIYNTIIYYVLIMYICAYVYTYLCMYIFVWGHICVYMYFCMIYMCILCVYMSIYLYIYLHICIFVCTYVYVCVCLHVYIFITSMTLYS